MAILNFNNNTNFICTQKRFAEFRGLNPRNSARRLLARRNVLVVAATFAESKWVAAYLVRSQSATLATTHCELHPKHRPSAMSVNQVGGPAQYPRRIWHIAFQRLLIFGLNPLRIVPLTVPMRTTFFGVTMVHGNSSFWPPRFSAALRTRTPF